ncbi:gfo/Idh/MocA family oxidoreductase [Loktanella sp. D2R18]|uniref:Gfo/Idh/MocA family protein n=1 Tax=Rhodobacterales TaxID=204455 RepID=UPI000DEA67C5|nr:MULTISPECIES: Gfo/Idh/MocA family oxidoreductase [Rhodobacterales]MDO6589097.1 Gfo/Idh/MocA family oxidoreductase [Yoonia sp. 1_MG-2023]RBW45465.1 gfo/Idh/MocA family oxidoreductase [Loktanella sp. D2R18]
MTPLRWGVLGAANFALNHMAPAIHAARGAEFAALATSNPDKATPFQAFAPGLRVHHDYDALLADPAIDAVYIPLPNHLHVEWAIKALEAGKHVLCEKPIALHDADFDALITTRDQSGKLAAEAFMIVHHPQFARARALVQGGAIGALKHVDAVFSYFNDDADNIRNQAKAGGGGLRDIGVYTFGAARYVTGAEPEAVPYAKLALENDVDVFAQVAADFPGFTYSAVVSMRMFNRQNITFHGDAGVLQLTCPFNANVFDQATLKLETDAGTVTTERFAGVNQYVSQVENFCKAAQSGSNYLCPLEFSRGTQKMVDMVFAAGER